MGIGKMGVVKMGIGKMGVGKMVGKDCKKQAQNTENTLKGKKLQNTKHYFVSLFSCKNPSILYNE